MMKYSKIIASALILSLVLTACGAEISVPDTADYPLLDSASAIADDANAALKSEYEAFSIDANCLIPTESSFVDQYYRLDYDWNVRTDDQCMSIIQQALELEGETFDRSKLTISEDDCGKAVGTADCYDYQSDTSMVGAATTAYMTYYADQTHNSYGGYEQEAVAQYRLNEGNSIEGVSYTVAGQEYSLTDAVAFCDQYIANLKEILNYESVLLRKIFVYRYLEDTTDAKAGDYCYVLYYSKTEEGVPLASDYSTFWDSNIPIMDASYIYFYISVPNEVSEWCDKSTHNVTGKTALDGVLPLSYALKKLDSEVAAYSNYTVYGVELKYASLQWQWDSSTFYYEPYWCIKLSQEVPDDTGTLGYEMGTVAYVNAVSGECYVNCSIRGSLLGMDQYFENPEWDPDTNPESQWRVKQ